MVQNFLLRESEVPHKKIGKTALSKGGTEDRERHHMSTIITSKSGSIDGVNVTAIATITPCVGGLIVWYAQTSVMPREADEKKDGAALAPNSKP